MHCQGIERQGIRQWCIEVRQWAYSLGDDRVGSLLPLASSYSGLPVDKLDRMGYSAVLGRLKGQRNGKGSAWKIERLIGLGRGRDGRFRGLDSKGQRNARSRIVQEDGRDDRVFSGNHARTRIVAYGIGYALYRGVGSLIHHNGEADNAGHYQGTTGRGERGTDGTG